MIANDQELTTSLERIRRLQAQFAHLRIVEMNPASYRLDASGFLAELDRMQFEVREYLWRHGMNAAASSERRIQQVRVTEDEIIAQLADGLVIIVLLALSRRLSEAMPRQRARFRLIGSGQGVHWTDVDEDISVEGMLPGLRAYRARSAAVPKRDGAPGGDDVRSKRRQPRRGKRRVQSGARGVHG